MTDGASTTDEEYMAKAMLLGMQYVKSGLLSIKIFRKRVGDGRFAGTALFSYFNADTLEPVPGLQERSELDNWGRS